MIHHQLMRVTLMSVNLLGVVLVWRWQHSPTTRLGLSFVAVGARSLWQCHFYQLVVEHRQLVPLHELQEDL